ncbi:hypothetical protein HDE_01996 [Halotydeus destructor]|nr:hypothetical protein HDE_01996 [Halotydeus destructor]
MHFSTCVEEGVFCYGGYDKADPDCIKKEDCHSALIGSTENGTIFWKLFFLLNNGAPTTDQLILSRQSSDVTSRNAIIFESDNPKKKRSCCVYAKVDGTTTVCSRSEHHKIFEDLPDKPYALKGHNGSRYAGYYLKSADVLTFPTRCPRVYFVAPKMEKMSITIRRLQYDSKTVMSEVNFDLIDVFGFGLQDGRTNYTPECYSPPKSDNTPTTTGQTFQTKESSETETDGATSQTAKTSSSSSLFTVIMVIIFVIVCVSALVYFMKKETKQDGGTAENQEVEPEPLQEQEVEPEPLQEQEVLIHDENAA